MTEGYSKKIEQELISLGVKPSKDKGQNFLIDIGALEEIIRFGHPSKNEKIIEIGGGLGALTAELAATGSITIIELEQEFCNKLEASFPNAQVICSDIRLFDLAVLGEDLVVFGNLPYSLSTDIILYLCQYAFYLKRAVVMLQKEFAERIFAVPGTKAYGTLSVHCQLIAQVRPGPVVPGTSFYPQASVESQVIEMLFHSEPIAKVEDQYIFQRVLQSAFFRRRKKVINSIKGSTVFSAEQVDQAFDYSGIDPNLRAENLTPKEFVHLANAFKASAKVEEI